MTTLIAVYTSDGCAGRCDAKCHKATHPDCNCLVPGDETWGVCGGMNHGAGPDQAAKNTHEHGISMIEAWKEQHPDTTGYDLASYQLSLFPDTVPSGRC